MGGKKHDEPKLDYDGFYKLHGHKPTGRLSRKSTCEIEKKLMEIYDEIED